MHLRKVLDAIPETSWLQWPTKNQTDLNCPRNGHQNLCKWLWFAGWKCFQRTSDSRQKSRNLKPNEWTIRTLGISTRSDACNVLQDATQIPRNVLGDWWAGREPWIRCLDAKGFPWRIVEVETERQSCCRKPHRVLGKARWRFLQIQHQRKMKPTKNQPDKHPVGITRLASATPEPYALFIMLDGEPHCEIAEKNHRAFEKSFCIWFKDTLPTLKRSVVRYFMRGRTDSGLEIIECQP